VAERNTQSPFEDPVASPITVAPASKSQVREYAPALVHENGRAGAPSGTGCQACGEVLVDTHHDHRWNSYCPSCSAEWLWFSQRCLDAGIEPSHAGFRLQIAVDTSEWT